MSVFGHLRTRVFMTTVIAVATAAAVVLNFYCWSWIWESLIGPNLAARYRFGK